MAAITAASSTLHVASTKGHGCTLGRVNMQLSLARGRSPLPSTLSTSATRPIEMDTDLHRLEGGRRWAERGMQERWERNIMCRNPHAHVVWCALHAAEPTGHYAYVGTASPRDAQHIMAEEILATSLSPESQMG